MEKIKSFHLYILLASIILYTITAWYSLGYYYFDEHYQVLEFANLKLGLTTADHLPWEHKAQIRAVAQPFVYILFYRIVALFDINDPYSLTFLTRLLSMCFSLITIRLYVLTNIKTIIPRFRKYFISFSYLLWFIPFLSIRFASETWSGNLIILAIIMVIRASEKPQRNLIYCGIFMGLAFIFRFQSAFALLGLVSYTYFIGKYKIKHIAFMILASIAVLAGSTLLDSWFYNSFVFTPWNYFQANIINGVASSFGTSPWYYYFETMLTKSILPIGAAILFLVFIAIIENPRHIAVWVTTPFLLIHMIVPHKELRFLFPLINILPILLTLGLEGISARLLRIAKRSKWIITGFVICLALINIVALSVMAFRPMRNGEKVITSIIYHANPNRNASVIIEKGVNPFNPLGNVQESTYYQKGLVIIEQEEVIKGTRLPETSKPIFFICKKQSADFPDNEEIIRKYNLIFKAQSIPSWIESLSIYLPWTRHNDPLLLFSQIDKSNP